MDKIYVVWLRPDDKTYLRSYKYLCFDKCIGFKNSYEHEIIEIFIIDENNKKINGISSSDIYYKLKNQKEKGLKSKLIRFLDK